MSAKVFESYIIQTIKPKTDNMKLCLILGLLITSINAHTQSNSLEWAKSIGGYGIDLAWSVVTDSNGNIYTIGDFSSTVDFDPGPFQQLLNSNGESDIFIQKLDINGNFLWVKQFGGNGFDSGTSITLDQENNIYATGGFEAVVDFDPSNETELLVSGGSWDIFILKLDEDGNFNWVKKVGGASDDKGNAITIDIEGNAIITGYFEGTIDFDPGGAYQSLSSNGFLDIYILKLNSEGEFIWAKEYGDFTDDIGYDVTTDSNGNIYATGCFRGIVDFDNSQAIETLTSLGNCDAYILKLDNEGNFTWVKQFGGYDVVTAKSLAVDYENNVVTTGYFEGAIDFENQNQIFTTEGSKDAFVNKLDEDGNLIWAKTFGGTAYDAAYAVSIDSLNSILITGGFSETVDFDPSELVHNLSSRGSQDIFIQKLNANGDLEWVNQIGGFNLETGYAIDVDVFGNSIIAGAFQGIINFNTNLNQLYISSNGIYDACIFQINECIPTTYIDSIIVCNSFTWIDGNIYTQSNNTAKYIYEGAASNGCDSIVLLNLIINNVTDTTFTLNENSIIANNNNATYQWLDCNNNFNTIVNEIDQEFTAIASGLYAVELTENGCVDTSICTAISIVGLINQNNLESKIKVYPNPSNGIYNIEFQNTIPDVKIILTDIIGKRIEANKYKNIKNIPFELTQPKGLYYIKVETPLGSITVPLFKR